MIRFLFILWCLGCLNGLCVSEDDMDISSDEETSSTASYETDDEVFSHCIMVGPAIPGLPNEIVVKILGYLKPADWFNVLPVSKALNGMLMCIMRNREYWSYFSWLPPIEEQIWDLLRKDPQQVFVFAVQHAHVLMARVALLNGANINGRLRDETTLLHDVLLRQDIRMVRFLIAHGIDINAQNNAGQTALVVANNMQLGASVREIMAQVEARRQNQQLLSNFDIRLGSQ